MTKLNVRINPRRDLQELPKETQASLRVLLFALMCVVFFLIHIWSRTWVVSKSYEIGQLRKERSALEAKLAQSLVERNRLMGPRNLERWVSRFEARGVHFASPRPDQIVYLENSEIAETMNP